MHSTDRQSAIILIDAIMLNHSSDWIKITHSVKLTEKKMLTRAEGYNLVVRILSCVGFSRAVMCVERVGWMKSLRNYPICQCTHKAFFLITLIPEHEQPKKNVSNYFGAWWCFAESACSHDILRNYIHNSPVENLMWTKWKAYN